MTDEATSPAAEIRDLFTGDKTPGDTFVPPLLFLIVNTFQGLTAAAGAAVAAGAVVAAWRIRKGQAPTYAAGGIIAVGFAALVAIRSGRPEGFFLPGIVGAGLGTAGAITSVALRRPMAAWASFALRRWPLEWYWRDDVRPAYSRVTWIWIGYFAVRFSGQLWLFLAERPEALAAFKFATSFPTIIPLLFVSHHVGTRRRDALSGPSVDEFANGAEPPWRGQRDGF